MAKLPFDLRFSLGETFLVALFAGVGLAALRMGDWLAAAATFLALIVVVTMAVVAVSADGDERRFAICFVLGATVYGAAVWYLGAGELDPQSGTLLSTRAMGPVRAATVDKSYFELGTGIPATIAEREQARSAEPTLMHVANGYPQYLAVVGGRNFLVQENPPLADFMRTAHVLWGLLIGYAAGKLGAAIYRRRTRLAAERQAASESPAI